MDIQTNWPPGETGIQTALDAVIDGLADAETGTPMFVRDYVRLGVFGIATPLLLLVWGWL